MSGSTGVTYDYGLRIYDTRIAKFLSLDPLTNKYPELTPYQFASNTPISAIDLDGAEAFYFELKFDKNNKTVIKNTGYWDKPFLGFIPIRLRYEVECNGQTFTFFPAQFLNTNDRGTDAYFNALVDLNNQLDRFEQSQSKGYESDQHAATRVAVENGIQLIIAGIISKDASGAAELKPIRPTEESTTAPIFKTSISINEAVAGTPSPARILLNKALARQGLNEPPIGFKEKWSENGYDYEVRIHEPQANAPSGSNSATQTTFRVARRQQGTDSNGQGNGWEMADDKGNWYKTSELKKGGQAADDTHIPIK